MDILSYVLIAACYALGCRLSWKLGLHRGCDFTLRTTLQELSEMSDKTPLELAELIRNHRKQKALKS